MTLTRRNLLQTSGAAGMAVIGASVIPNPAKADEFTMRLHGFLPPQALIPSAIMDVWADNVEAVSNGRITIQRFPAMQLGGTPPDLIDQAIDGSIAQIAWTLPGYSPGRFPLVEIFELPFMMTNAGATSRAYWTMVDRYMQEGDFADFEALGAWVHGPGLIHSADPIRLPEDLNGVTLRAPTRVTNGMFSAMGASTIGMPVPAVPEALSRGVIDATVIPWEVTTALRIAELVENHTEFAQAPLYTAAFVLAMHRGSFNALPEDLQEAVRSVSGADFSEFAGTTMQEGDPPARQVAVDAGNNIIELTDAEIDIWREAALPSKAAWIAEMTEQGLDAAGLVAEAEGLIAEFTM